MAPKINLNKVYQPSQDVVARDIQGEFILIPITSGIGDLEDEIFSLNGTGRAIWEQLDGKKSLKEAAESLSSEFDADAGTIEEDVAGLAGELAKMKMILEVK